MKRQFDLFAYDGATTAQLTNTPYNEAQQYLRNGTLVWVGWDGQHTQIFQRRNGQTVQLTQDPFNHLAPRTDADRRAPRLSGRIPQTDCPLQGRLKGISMRVKSGTVYATVYAAAIYKAVSPARA